MARKNIDMKLKPLQLLPKRRLDGILKLKVARLAVVRDGHHVDRGVVELDPGNPGTVRGEPQRPDPRQTMSIMDKNIDR